MDPATGQALVESVDFLSQKDLKWWFAGLFFLFVMTGLWIFKWFLNHHQANLESLYKQLGEQRVANSTLNERIITYVSGDHILTLQTIKEVSETLRRISETILKIENKLDNQ